MNRRVDRRNSGYVKRYILVAVGMVTGGLGCAPSTSAHSPTLDTTQSADVAAPALGACSGFSRGEELVCRCELRISRAREHSDPSVLSCYSQKSSELRATFRHASEIRDAAAAPGEDAELERQKLAEAERILERQYAALDECAAGHRATDSDGELRVFAPTTYSER